MVTSRACGRAARRCRSGLQLTADGCQLIVPFAANSRGSAGLLRLLCTPGLKPGVSGHKLVADSRLTAAALRRHLQLQYALSRRSTDATCWRWSESRPHSLTATGTLMRREHRYRIHLERSRRRNHACYQGNTSERHAH